MAYFAMRCCLFVGALLAFVLWQESLPDPRLPARGFSVRNRECSQVVDVYLRGRRVKMYLPRANTAPCANGTSKCTFGSCLTPRDPFNWSAVGAHRARVYGDPSHGAENLRINDALDHLRHIVRGRQLLYFSKD